MSLNVKNPRAHELAIQLAKMTGENLTTAVIRALELRLEQEQRQQGQASKAKRMTAFAERFAAGMPPRCKSSDHDDLYDEDGLPR